jgi:hypothetical protein
MRTFQKIIALAAVTLIIALIIAPASSFAQTATGSGNGATTSGNPAVTPNAGTVGAGSTGVSGIPPGPGNAGGNNNSVYDPSGIGNASRIPPPNTTGSATGTPGR